MCCTFWVDRTRCAAHFNMCCTSLKSIDSYTNSGCTFRFEMCNQRNPNFKCATNEIVRSIKRKLKRMLNKLIFKNISLSLLCDFWTCIDTHARNLNMVAQRSNWGLSLLGYLQLRFTNSLRIFHWRTDEVLTNCPISAVRRDRQSTGLNILAPLRRQLNTNWQLTAGLRYQVFAFDIVKLSSTTQFSATGNIASPRFPAKFTIHTLVPPNTVPGYRESTEITPKSIFPAESRNAIPGISNIRKIDHKQIVGLKPSI